MALHPSMYICDFGVPLYKIDIAWALLAVCVCAFASDWNCKNFHSQARRTAAMPNYLYSHVSAPFLAALLGQSELNYWLIHVCLCPHEYWTDCSIYTDISSRATRDRNFVHLPRYFNVFLLKNINLNRRACPGQIKKNERHVSARPHTACGFARRWFGKEKNGSFSIRLRIFFFIYKLYISYDWKVTKNF